MTEPQPAVPTGAQGAAHDLLAPYDAVLLLSFGGPEQPDDVMPFLQNVTAGRGIPHERLAVVAEHYLQFGGRSPINDQNRALHRGAAGRARRPRPDAAGAVGQPQLGRPTSPTPCARPRTSGAAPARASS